MAPQDALQVRLGRFFKDPALLEQALTHPSAAVEAGLPRRASYERLEFLGDALLNFLVGELLFHRFPGEEEGTLSRMRAFWVSQPVLAEVARSLGLGAALRFGRGERRQEGSGKERILASALEALLGALYLDGGLPAARRLVQVHWRDAIRRRGLGVLDEDAKTRLQEARQARGLPLPVYRTGPEGEGFVSVVLLDGEEAGEGRGPTRKAAEQAAARRALARLQEAGPSGDRGRAAR
ncbi:MAG: ribonuclease III [Acidobacteriota bacterium]